MRFLFKLALKLALMVAMVILLSGGIRYAQPYLMRAAGLKADKAENPNFSADESDLMSTVFQSALRLVTGQASRNQLAGELSDKLYAGRANSKEMSELGIDIVKSGAPVDPKTGLPVPPKAGAATDAPSSGTNPANPTATTGAQAVARKALASTATPAVAVGALGKLANTDMVSRLRARFKDCSVELTMGPIVLLGFFVVGRRRRRGRGGLDDLLPLGGLAPIPSDSEPYDMKHPVRATRAEDFELLVALIYQRQGYRVSMPAALGGGRGGDFMLLRKAEKVLVQCKRHAQDHRVHVDRLKELHDAVAVAGATSGLYVASCGFSWDARNYSRRNGILAINARTLDELILAAREKPTEDLLAVADWAPKLMGKVQFSVPACPTCEAPMDEIEGSSGPVWVCSMRPDCRGRRSARKYQKPSPNRAAASSAAPAKPVASTEPAVSVTTLPGAPVKPLPPKPGRPVAVVVSNEPAPGPHRPTTAVSSPPVPNAARPAPITLGLGSTDPARAAKLAAGKAAGRPAKPVHLAKPVRRASPAPVQPPGRPMTAQSLGLGADNQAAAVSPSVGPASTTSSSPAAEVSRTPAPAPAAIVPAPRNPLPVSSVNGGRGASARAVRPEPTTLDEPKAPKLSQRQPPASRVSKSVRQPITPISPVTSTPARTAPPAKKTRAGYSAIGSAVRSPDGRSVRDSAQDGPPRRSAPGVPARPL